jgi:hypothetical protein
MGSLPGAPRWFITEPFARRTKVAVSRRRLLFGPVIHGQWSRVSLPSYQQTVLNGMDRALEDRDPRLATMFAIFTRLTREEGPPVTEQLVRGAHQAGFKFRGILRRAPAAIPILLVACLMIGIIVLGITTASGRSCPPSTTLHQIAPGRGLVCRPSANGLRK